MSSLLIKNCRIKGVVSDITISGGLITGVTQAGRAATASRGGRAGTADPAATVLDAGGRAVIPGVIDPHVHFRCPGMEYKEDWVSGSRAALAGGVTTVIDMPNTIPPAESAEAFELKAAASAAADRAGRPIGRLFWAGASPGSLPKLPALLSLPTAAGVKIFFSESSGNSSCSGRDFIRAVFTAAAEAGKPAAVHTEMAGLLAGDVDPGFGAGVSLGFGAGPGGCREPDWLRLHNLMRPPEAAEAGTRLALSLAAETGCRLYLCHLSTAGEFEMVREHKQRYGRNSVIAELTPHHLLLDENLVVSGGPQSWARVNPPLRSPADRVAAGRALAEGVIDLIGSDHAPHTPAEKAVSTAAEFLKCPSGFPGLETLLGAAGGFLKEGFPDWEQRLVELTSARAAVLFGLADRGAIEPGKRADLAVLGGPAVVDSGTFKSKAAYSPFNGMRMALSVYKTILGGKIFEQ